MIKLHYPVDKSLLDVRFGKDFSKHPIKKGYYKLFDNKHPGVDFKTKVGGIIYASFEGIVVRREFHTGMGNVIGIRNGNILALYAHLKEFSVELGSIIKQGGIVGLAGDTGQALTEPHLHFELRNLSKTKLSEAVFLPSFEEILTKYTEQFDYVVNNANSNKTLSLLSNRYFGSDKYIYAIKKENHILEEGDTVLKDGFIIQIPNF